jgi:hypothetical protein
MKAFHSPPFRSVCLSAVLFLVSVGLVRAQFTVQNPYLRIWFDDGYSTTQLVGAGATPAPGNPFGGPITGANGVSLAGNIYPSPAYTYNSPPANAIASMNFQVFTYPGQSNYVGLPGAFGAFSATLSQTVPGQQARLRVDWSIDYFNSTLNTYNMSPLAYVNFQGNLPNFGDYAQVKYELNYYNYNTLASSLATTPSGGDAPIGNYQPTFWWRENPQTLGAFQDYPTTLGGAIVVNPGDTFREDGYFDLLVDPLLGHAYIDNVPEPAVGGLLFLAALIWRRCRR